MSKRKAFISSVSKELEKYRTAVIEAVREEVGWEPVHMEAFGAKDAQPDDYCRARVGECDAFVGILGLCYGSVHEASGKSFTEREYDEAVDQEKPRHMYLTPEGFQMDGELIIEDGRAKEQKAFRAKVEAQITRDGFRSPDNLARRVIRDLHALTPGPAPSPSSWPKEPLLAHPYPLQPGFTGRLQERRMLTDWLQDGYRPVMVLEAIGGMGKSMLSWAWLHWDCLGMGLAGYPQRKGPKGLQIAQERRPEGVIFWSFYEQDAHFGAFLREAAKYVGAPDGLSERDKLEALLQALSQRRLLLILDGFERELRAYSGYRAPYQGDEAADDANNGCVDPRAAVFLQYAANLPLRGRVLLTSRLLPHELKDLAGCRREPLTDFDIEDVVTYFQGQGVKGTRAEIADAVRPYGGHPLSMSLLAKAIVKDRKMHGDIRAAGRHTVFEKLQGQGKHHVLEMAFNELAADCRELLGRLAAFRSPMDYDAIEAVAPDKGEKLDGALDELEQRGLLLRDEKTDRYDLHPIVRRYAYDRLSDKEGVHGRLQGYFEALPAPERVEELEDLTPTIELYWHMVGAGQLDAALELCRDRLQDPLYYRFGAYAQMIELLGALFLHGEGQAPRLKEESDQAWALNALALSYGNSGQPRRAVPLLEMHNALREKADSQANLAVGLCNLAYRQRELGQLEAAEAALRRSIEIGLEIENQFREAVGRQELGRLLSHEGRFGDAEQELTAAGSYFRESGNEQFLGVNEAYRAELELLREQPKAALHAAREAHRLADVKSYERDIVETEWALGWAHAALGETDDAERHLHKALTRCRRINLVQIEPSILLALARLHRDRALAEEALAIADRCEFRLNQADIHNLLAGLALDDGDLDLARRHAEIAKERAECDGPPHRYEPAYQEAERLLREIGAA